MSRSARPVAYVFDSAPLAAYARGRDLMVPSLLATSLARDRLIALSAVALAEAYRALDGESVDVLDMLTGGELAAGFLVLDLDTATARQLGREALAEPPGGARRTGPLWIIHTAALAAEHTAGVVTADPEPYRELLGEDWPLLTI